MRRSVFAEPLVDQRGVARDRVAVPGEDDLGRQLPRLPQRVDVGDQRLRPPVRAVERAADQRVRRDRGKEVVGGDQDPPLGVPEGGVRRAVARAVHDLQPPVAQLQQLAVAQRPRDLRARSPGPEAARDALQGDYDVLGNAAAEHQLGGELVVQFRVLGEVGEPPHRGVERRHLGARVLDDDLDQPEVVDVLVSEDHQLEIVDRTAVVGELVLELVERLAGVRPGVDQRERVVLDQVAVDAADGERRGDRQAMDSRLGSAREGLLRRHGSAPAPDRASAPCPHATPAIPD